MRGVSSPAGEDSPVPPAPVPPCGAKPPSDRAARWFVRGLWALLSVALLFYVGRYGSTVPWEDDWELVPVFTHVVPLDGRWLWWPQNEHRFPLTKLTLFALSELTQGDYRAGLWVTAGLLCVTALLAAEAARRTRGQARFTDAFAPLALLHWGHEQNLLHQVQLFFVVAGLLACGFGLAVARARRWGAGPALLLGAVVALLPLHGAMGLAMAPPLAAWAAGAGVAHVRRGPRRGGIVLLAGGLAAFGLVAAYLLDFARPPHHPVTPSMLASARAALEVLSTSLGPSAAALWPYPAAALAVLMLLTIALLVRKAAAEPAERWRGLGLLACVLATLLLAALMGWGRAGMGAGSGLQPRYAVLTLPGLFATYCAWMLYAGRAGVLVQRALFVAAAAGLVANMASGARYGSLRRQRALALEADIRAGLGPAELGPRHFPFFYHPSAEVLASRLAMLRHTRTGPYRGLPSAAALPARACGDWVTVPVLPLGAHELDWTAGEGRVRGRDPYVILGLPEAPLCAFRLTITLRVEAARRAPLKLYWALAPWLWFSEGPRSAVAEVPSGDDPQVVTVGIDGWVNFLRLDPDESSSRLRLWRLEIRPRR
jgi:hypothetical protein